MIITKSNNYHQVLSELYPTDNQFISDYPLFHSPMNKSLEGYIEDSVNTFKNIYSPFFEFFEIKDSTRLIGYFGKETVENKEYLMGFFIHPDYRKKDILPIIWNEIRTEFKSPFITCVHHKNNKAIKFLQKNNGTILANIPHGNHEYCVLEVI